MRRAQDARGPPARRPRRRRGSRASRSSSKRPGRRPSAAAAARERARRRARRRRAPAPGGGWAVCGARHSEHGRTRKDRFAAGAAIPAARVAGAVRAGAAQHDVVRADRRSRAARPRSSMSRSSSGSSKASCLPQRLADGVVVMVAARVGGLEAGGAVDVDAVHEPERGEHVERAVDAGEARRRGPSARSRSWISWALRQQRWRAEQGEHLARGRRPRGARRGTARCGRARPRPVAWDVPRRDRPLLNENHFQ